MDGGRSFLRAFFFVLLENTLVCESRNGRKWEGEKTEPPLFFHPFPPKSEMMPRLLHRQCAESAESPTPKRPCIVGHWHWFDGPEQKVMRGERWFLSARAQSGSPDRHAPLGISTALTCDGIYKMS